MFESVRTPQGHAGVHSLHQEGGKKVPEAADRPADRSTDRAAIRYTFGPGDAGFGAVRGKRSMFQRKVTECFQEFPPTVPLRKPMKIRKRHEDNVDS